MGVPLGTSFDVASAEPIDSRIVWTGTVENLNNIQNKYQGLVAYVPLDQNLYVCQPNGSWEKLVTTNVDSITFFSDFEVNHTHNGQVIYANSPDQIICTFVGSVSDYPIGYNVTLIQENVGNIVIQSAPNIFIESRSVSRTTAGQYAVASVLRAKNSNLFILYGDLI